MSDEEKPRDKVGPDGKCVMTGHPCTCIPKTLGHWCCWSIPADKLATLKRSEGK